METEDIAAAAIRRRRHWHGQRYDLCLSRLPGRVELIGDAGVAVLDSTALKVAFYSSGVLEAGDGAAGGGTGADPMAFPHAYHQALITDVLDASVTAAIPESPAKRRSRTIASSTRYWPRTAAWLRSEHRLSGVAIPRTIQARFDVIKTS